MAVVSDAELYIISATSSGHALTFAHIHRHWLFTEHMSPRFGSGDRLGRMQTDGRGDVHSVDLLIEQ